MGNIIFAQHSDGTLNHQSAVAMYRLRHEVFHDRLGWDVTSDNGMEHDEFDQANPVYVLVRGENDEVLGCWRLLPTTGPNMLRDTFPQLMHGQPVPAQSDVWELSRFAIASDKLGSGSFGLSNTPIQMVQAAVKFAQKNGIKRYVSVTSVAIERMFRKLGVRVTRLGSPIKIGNVLTVACALEIDEITIFALFGTLPEQADRLAA